MTEGLWRKCLPGIFPTDVEAGNRRDDGTNVQAEDFLDVVCGSSLPVQTEVRAKSCGGCHLILLTKELFLTSVLPVVGLCLLLAPVEIPGPPLWLGEVYFSGVSLVIDIVYSRLLTKACLGTSLGWNTTCALWLVSLALSAASSRLQDLVLLRMGFRIVVFFVCLFSPVIHHLVLHWRERSRMVPAIMLILAIAWGPMPVALSLALHLGTLVGHWLDGEAQVIARAAVWTIAPSLVTPLSRFLLRCASRDNVLLCPVLGVSYDLAFTLLGLPLFSRGWFPAVVFACSVTPRFLLCVLEGLWTVEFCHQPRQSAKTQRLLALLAALRIFIARLVAHVVFLCGGVLKWAAKSNVSNSGKLAMLYTMADSWEDVGAACLGIVLTTTLFLACTGLMRLLWFSDPVMLHKEATTSPARRPQVAAGEMAGPPLNAWEASETAPNGDTSRVADPAVAAGPLQTEILVEFLKQHHSNFAGVVAFTVLAVLLTFTVAETVFP